MTDIGHAQSRDQQLVQAADQAQADSNSRWNHLWNDVAGLPKAVGEHEDAVEARRIVSDRQTAAAIENTAGAAGNAVAGGFHSAHVALEARARAEAREGQQLGDENPGLTHVFSSIGNIFSATVSAPGNMYAAAQQRERDFAASRPGTANLALRYPVLQGPMEDYALLVGGLPHKADAHLAPAKPAPAAEVVARPPAPAPAQPARADAAAQPAKPPHPAAHAEAADQPAKPAHHHAAATAQAEAKPRPAHAGERSVEIARGEGYWRASRRYLGEDASNREVLAMVAKLERANNGEAMLHQGDVIHFT